MNVRLAICVIVAIVSGCAPVYTLNSDSITPLQALAEARALDGQEVSISGWLTLEPENRNIWQTKRAMQEGDADSGCITVVNASVLYSATRSYNREHVTLNGVFRAELPTKTEDGRLILRSGCSDSGLVLAADQRFMD